MGLDFKVDGEIGELKPGATPRRWEPEDGIKKHIEKIHKESKFTDNNKNLPFSFSKPKKLGRRSIFKCAECDYVISASVNAVGLICPECKKFTKIKEVLL